MGEPWFMGMAAGTSGRERLWGVGRAEGKDVACSHSKPSLGMSTTKPAYLKFWEGKSLCREE